jgi:CRISPR type IV-associated protein Csf3
MNLKKRAKIRGNNMYRITFDLSSPLIAGDQISLDGLLAWCAIEDAKYQEKLGSYEEIDHIVNDLPLKKFPFISDRGDDFFYGATSMFTDPEALVAVDTVYVNKRFPLERAMEFLPHYKPQINEGSGFNKGYRIPFETITVNRIYFDFDGDPEKVGELLNNWMLGLGKKTSIGFGHIRKIHPIREVAGSPLVSPEGFARRTIPVAAAAAVGVQNGLERTAMVFYRPPYSPYHPERRAECIVPKALY